MAQKSSSSSSSGIDEALEGEPIITWTCAVLKECLWSQGGRFSRKKNTSFGGRSFTWWRKVGLAYRLKAYPAWFLQSYLLSQKPRGCNDTGKVLFLDAERQTTRQRSRTTALARVHCLHRLSYPLMVHILPICIPSRQLYEKLFRGSVAISNKKKLSQFLLKKLVWFCEWAIIILSGCSWNFFSEPLCEMHSVVTVKTVVHFNHANIFCTRNKIRCWQFVMRSRTIYQKNRRCRWNKKMKDDSNARECDEKTFLKENMMLVNQPSESANTKEVRKKGDWKRTMLVNAMIRIIFFFERQNMMLVKQPCESTSNGWRKSESKKKKLKGNTACECDDKFFFERQNMTLLITRSRSLMDPLHNSLTK